MTKESKNNKPKAAVGLKYDKADSEVPKVIAKGFGDLADEIIELTKRMADVEQQGNDNDEATYEVRTGAIGLGEKVKEIAASINNIELKFLELEQQDPASKLYHRAAKLVADGVTLEELMQECDLPRAEAQLLYDLHKK